MAVFSLPTVTSGADSVIVLFPQGLSAPVSDPGAMTNRNDEHLGSAKLGAPIRVVV